MKVFCLFSKYKSSICTRFSNGIFFVRELNSSFRLEKTTPQNLKGKSKSSQDWLTRQLNDQYVIKCRYDRYRCRSAYKLIQMDERFHILKPGLAVVDCGAAPGSWTQVVVKKLKLDTEPNDGEKRGLVIAVDLQYFEPIKGAVMIKESNFMEQSVQDHIFSLLPGGKADVILSDMAPKATGTQELDAAVIMSLVTSALKFATRTLRTDGTFLCKVWDNQNVEKMICGMQNIFTSVKRVKPNASRSDSAELFLLARGYKNNFK